MPLDFLHLQALAAACDLDLVGVTAAGPTPTWDTYAAWIARGHAAEMGYLTRPAALHRRADPRHILPEARSVLVVGAQYVGGPLPPLPALHGRVSRYAWGEDYHRWLLRRLEVLVARIHADVGPGAARYYVDTGPVLERAWAVAADLGWIGKHGCLIHPRLGSYIFLGVALLEAALPRTPPASPPGQCGDCTRCLAACPTGALVAPGEVDARRCLAYLTIEHRGAIPPRYRAAQGARVFGCDACQEVCPWNQRPLAVPAPPSAATLDLPPLLRLTAEEFRACYRHTAIWRATPAGLARNAAVVLGNLGDPAAIPALEEAVRTHPSAMVREHASWSLRRLRDNAKSELEKRAFAQIQDRH